MKYNEWCLAALTLAMCTQRMSIAAGNIFYGLAILFFLLHLYQRHQAGETFTVPKDCKRYFLVYGLYALLLLPSVFFSVDPGRSLSKFADYFIGRIWVLPILLFLKSMRKQSRRPCWYISASLPLTACGPLGNGSTRTASVRTAWATAGCGLPALWRPYSRPPWCCG